MARRERRRAKGQVAGGPVDDMLRAALAHHRAGRVEAAATLYKRVLSQSPGHADALHLFGVLRAQAGRLEKVGVRARRRRRAPARGPVVRVGRAR